MIALFIVPIVLVAFISYYLGRNRERAEWDKLFNDVELSKTKQQ